MNDLDNRLPIEKPKQRRPRNRHGLEHYTLPGGGNVLHIFSERDEWFMWLNTGVADFDGVCIGTGDSRQEAAQDAADALEKALEVLNGPAPLTLV